MGEKPESTGWWQTLPGILTATAGILTAIGGLIVAFHQAGFLRHDSQKAPQVQNEMVKPSRTPEYPDTAPSATKPQSRSEPSYPVTLAASYQVRAGDAVYKILAARLDRYAPGKLSLRFDVRMTNNGRFDANFWAASFRLLVDGVPQAPENSLNELVAGHSAKDGMVEFVIPNTVTEVGLKVGDVGESAPTIPISLTVAKP